MNRYLLTVLLLTSLLYSCSSDTASETDSATANNTTAPPAETTQAPTYPSIPADTIRALFNECDYIDYVFYYTNFSVSQKEKRDIQTAITYIASETPQINPSCQAVGRVFYQVDGENRLEADLYFNPNQGCIYYLFFQDGKPAYANRIMPAGIDFYTKIFQSAQSAQ
ncbi:hypothetical protein [Phaeodactylibacter xiamenensis]|jgi:hypothetical protein|uniref:hypothetical protein n=1 Tax=Phaeodactylibacter xiamenensis TaxID=1524460 RepID=UPI003BA996F3